MILMCTSLTVLQYDYVVHADSPLGYKQIGKISPYALFFLIKKATDSAVFYIISK